MAYPLGLTVKSLVGIAGAFGATTGGVLLFNIGGLGDFEVRVRDVIEDLGVSKSWCAKRGNKYVCDKKKSQENLKKIVFASRHNVVDAYELQGNSNNAEIEIWDTGDVDIFPKGVKFVVLGNGNGNLTIKRNTDNQKGKWSSNQVNIWTKGGELKVLGKKLMWVWEEVNDVSKMVGLGCKDTTTGNTTTRTCTFNEKLNIKLNVMDGKRKVEGAKIDTGKVLNFDRWQSGFFQGYKFTTKEDIQLKDEKGNDIGGRGITKLEGNKPYQIVKSGGKWYLSKVG